MRIKVYKYMSYFKRIVPYFLIFLPLFFNMLFKKKKKKDIWLISERGDEARDNGYHLFKYIRSNYPEIEVYYVIDSKSSDYKKISNYDNLIEPNSKTHFEKFILAKKLISTHPYGAAPYGKASKPFLYMMKEKAHINLRHGITMSEFKRKDKNIDLFVCSSDREKKCFEDSDEKFLNAIQILGICRYDSLKDESKNDERFILVMPTFRKWLEDISRLPNSIEYFKKEDYYIYWKKLLENKKLHDLLKRNNMKLLFYPHYRSQKYLKEFQIDNERIISASKEEYDIQSLLKKASLLITDYSSVHFDFAYMKKPVLYYQFDKTKFNQSHYKFKYTYEEAGLGPVMSDCDDVTEYVSHIINQDFKMDEKYEIRLQDTFKYQDDKNTERNFLAIKKL